MYCMLICAILSNKEILSADILVVVFSFTDVSGVLRGPAMDKNFMLICVSLMIIKYY